MHFFREMVFVVALIVVELISSGVTTVNNHAPDSPFLDKGYSPLMRHKREREVMSAGNGIAKIAANNTSSGEKNGESSSASSTTSNNISGSEVKIKTLVIPDRSPPNISVTQMKEDSGDDDDDKVVADNMPGDTFDEKAVQRAIIVIAGIAVIIVAYLGIKFFLLKKRKVVKRYGRLESSEMDLLDQIEDDEESEEEEELFDITQHNQRRST